MEGFDEKHPRRWCSMFKKGLSTGMFREKGYVYLFQYTMNDKQIQKGTYCTNDILSYYQLMAVYDNKHQRLTGIAEFKSVSMQNNSKVDSQMRWTYLQYFHHLHYLH